MYNPAPFPVVRAFVETTFQWKSFQVVEIKRVVYIGTILAVELIKKLLD